MIDINNHQQKGREEEGYRLGKVELDGKGRKGRDRGWDGGSHRNL
jgi:hypothetical protein